MLNVIRRTDPDRAADFAAKVMRAIGPWLPEHRTGRANLAAAYPDKPAAEIDVVLRGVWDNLGRLAAEYAHFDRLWDYDSALTGQSRVEFSTETLERFERLRGDGKPALVFGAHLANWELPALAAAERGLDVAVLYQKLKIETIDQAIRKIRSLKIRRLVSASRGAAVEIAGALARGAHVGLLVDQFFRRRNGVDVIFFGRVTRANPLIARLARHFDCPIHGTRVIRLPGHRFRIELTNAIDPPRDSDGKIDIAGTMQVITSIIEGWVREHPEQWLWVHQRWR